MWKRQRSLACRILIFSFISARSSHRSAQLNGVMHMQTASPGSGANVPAGQRRQSLMCVAPVWLTYLPMGHLEHDSMYRPPSASRYSTSVGGFHDGMR